MTFKRINPEEEDWEKKLKKIMDRDIKSYMKEKDLLDSANIVMEPLFIEKIMAYPNIGKLKPPLIDPYDRTKDLVDHV